MFVSWPSTLLALLLIKNKHYTPNLGVRPKTVIESIDHDWQVCRLWTFVFDKGDLISLLDTNIDLCSILHV